MTRQNYKTISIELPDKTKTSILIDLIQQKNIVKSTINDIAFMQNISLKKAHEIFSCRHDSEGVLIEEFPANKVKGNREHKIYRCLDCDHLYSMTGNDNRKFIMFNQFV